MAKSSSATPFIPTIVINRDSPESTPDMVNHPAHYNSNPSGIECIEVIQWMSFNIGSAIKYTWRHGLKPGVDALQDLEKAKWYIEQEIKRIKTTNVSEKEN